MAARLRSHLWHCVSEGSFLSVGWGCVHSRSVTHRGCLGRQSGVWKEKEDLQDSLMGWLWNNNNNNKTTQSSLAALWPFHIRRREIGDLQRGRIIIHTTKKKSKNPFPKISFEGAALPATYIPFECFSLLHLSARLIWRTLFSRRLRPCLYFDIRRQRKPLCPLFRFHLYTFAVNLRVVLVRRSMEHLLARGLLGEAAAYQLGL